MSTNFFKAKKGIDFENMTGSTVTTEGSTAYNVTSHKLEIHDGTSAKSLTTDTGTSTISNKTIDNSNIITVQDSNLTIQDNGDNTKQAKFEASSITTGTTRTYTLPDASTTVVGTATTQTLSNKTLDNTSVVTVQDSNFTIQDNGDNTKQLKFEVSGVTTATTRTLTVPDANTTLVGTGATQTLSNKSLVDNSTSIVDNADATKTILFDAGGTTGTSTTITAAQTANRVVTLPNATTTLVGTDTTDALTNKTISDAITFAQIATPANPSAGFDKVYVKSDDKVYIKTSAGVETLVGPSAGGAALAVFKVRKSTGQSITSGSTIQITWAAANLDYDTASGFNDGNDNYVIPTTGYYRISALMYSPADGNGSRILLYKINGTGAEHYLQRIHGSGDQDSHWGGSASHSLSAGDTVAIYVNQNSGSTLSMGGDPDSVFFSVEQIR